MIDNYDSYDNRNGQLGELDDHINLTEKSDYVGEAVCEDEEYDGPGTKEELFENALASVIFVNEYETLETRGTCSMMDTLSAAGVDQEEILGLMTALAPSQQTAAGVYLECFEVLGVSAEFEEYCAEPDSYGKAQESIKNLLLWHLS